MGLNNSIEERYDEENDSIEYENGSREEIDEYWHQDD